MKGLNMKSKWNSCPMCGSVKIKRVKKTLNFKIKNKMIKVPNLVFDECDTCKEQFFDEEANNKIDSYISRSAKKLTIPSK